MLASARWKLASAVFAAVCLTLAAPAAAQPPLFSPPPGGRTVEPTAPPPVAEPRDVDFPDLPADVREEPAAPTREEAQDLGLPYVPDATRTAPVEGVAAPPPAPAGQANAPLRYREPPVFPYNPCGPVPGPTLNLGYDVFDLTRNFAQHFLPARPIPPDPRVLGPHCTGPGCRMPTCADQCWWIRKWGWWQPYCPACGAPRGLPPRPFESVRCACDALEGCHGDDEIQPYDPTGPYEHGDTEFESHVPSPYEGPAAYVPEQPYEWQLLPRDLIWHSYLAGAKEPRFRSVWSEEQDQGWLWDVTLGGRAGILRYGDQDPLRPHGWQLDIEGAAMVRLDPEEERDVVATDYRFGVPISYGVGQYQMKIAYYHLSSHLGDEFLLKNPGVTRYNYARDVIVWGHSYYWTDALRLYGEAGWAFYADVSEPWEFQFGIDYAPALPTGIAGAPFAAINGHLREEVDFGGNLVVQAGWAWRGRPNGGLFRLGCEYYTGMDEQFEFYNQHVEKIGLGLWYDF